jgi:hypothetical protein
MFTLLLVTTMGTSQIPGLSDAECRWMVLSAPLAVAEVSEDEVTQSGIDARCRRTIFWLVMCAIPEFLVLATLVVLR